jgi:predicted RNA-binding Zn-ribbon protein involved in translation (DUF1610 family)
MLNLFKKTKTLKSDLLSFKNEPLSGLSVFLLIVLDLFIFSNVMMGIRGETAKSPSAYVYYPQSCSTHFDAPKRSYEAFDTSFMSSYATFKQKINPYCQELQVKIDRFAKTPMFHERLKSVRSINDQRRKNNSRLETLSKQYNTRLFEQIARMPNNQALLSAKNEYDALHEENKNLDAKMAAIPPLSSLGGYAAYRDYVTENREAYKSARKSYTFWQPFKEFGHVLVFILPLLAIFGYFYYRSKRKELRGEHYNPVVKIISTHISLILMLPVVWYTLYIIYHVIPKTLLKKIIDFLIEIGLLSILNYLAIGVVVLLFGFLIFWIQKRTIAHKKIGSAKNVKKIVSFSQCPSCDYRVDYTMPYCPYCGEQLLHPCAVCGHPTIAVLPYCQHCGVKRQTGNEP